MLKAENDYLKKQLAALDSAGGLKGVSTTLSEPTETPQQQRSPRYGEQYCPYPDKDSPRCQCVAGPGAINPKYWCGPNNGHIWKPTETPKQMQAQYGPQYCPYKDKSSQECSCTQRSPQDGKYWCGPL